MRPFSRIAPSARLLSAGFLLAGLGACSYMPSVTKDRVLGMITPYRVEVVQGNVLTKEMVAQVKPGMNRSQVRDLLGSPLLTDIFHGERWDYVFTIRRQGAEPQSRKVVALFEGENLKSLDVPPDLPGENEFVASITTFKRYGELPKLALTDAERQALPVPVKPPAPPVEPIGAVRSYPPLEPKS
jgi:outer membrane protein assembly factor BamE